MPCLVQITMEEFGKRRLYDVTFTKPVDFVPGTRETAPGQTRYGYFYIEDREFDDPDLLWLVEDVVLETVEVEPGVFAEVTDGNRRRRRPRVNVAPGQLSRFYTWTPYDSAPNDVKFTWAQVAAFVEAHT